MLIMSSFRFKRGKNMQSHLVEELQENEGVEVRIELE